MLMSMMQCSKDVCGHRPLPVSADGYSRSTPDEARVVYRRYCLRADVRTATIRFPFRPTSMARLRRSCATTAATYFYPLPPARSLAIGDLATFVVHTLTFLLH